MERHPWRRWWIAWAMVILAVVWLALFPPSCSDSQARLEDTILALDAYLESPSPDLLIEYLRKHDDLDTSYRYQSWGYLGYLMAEKGFTVGDDSTDLEPRDAQVLSELLESAPPVYEDLSPWPAEAERARLRFGHFGH